MPFLSYKCKNFSTVLLRTQNLIAVSVFPFIDDLSDKIKSYDNLSIRLKY